MQQAAHSITIPGSDATVSQTALTFLMVLEEIGHLSLFLLSCWASHHWSPSWCISDDTVGVWKGHPPFFYMEEADGWRVFFYCSVSQLFSHQVGHNWHNWHSLDICWLTKCQEVGLATMVEALGVLCKALHNEVLSKLVQLDKVLSGWLKTSAYLSSSGISEGSYMYLADGTCSRLNEWLFQDSAPASPFSTPAICYSNIATSYLTKKKNRFHDGCIARSSLLLPEFRIATINALTHLHLIIYPTTFCPTLPCSSLYTGISSLIIMCSFNQETSHSGWNHYPAV